MACLAMFLKVSYEDALIALGSEVPGVLRRGVARWSQLRRASESLGVRLVVKRKWTLSDEGILCVKHKKEEHVVVLRHGLIFDTNYKVWTFSDYDAAPPRAPFGALLVREDA